MPNWTVSPVMTVPGQHTVCGGIAALSRDDVWLVGELIVFPAGAWCFAEHWNGTSWAWNTFPLPSATPPTAFSRHSLADVCAIDRDDVWAVGQFGQYPAALNVGSCRPLLYHYDGVGWQLVFCPYASDDYNTLYAVHGRETHDIWAVGTYRSLNTPQRSLIVHYDGVSWQLIYAPHVGESHNQLFGVAALERAALVVGLYWVSPSEYQALVLHWDGAWKHRTVSTGGPSTALYDVAGISGNDAWAVGSKDDGSHRRPLAVHWDGDHWTEIPTAPMTHQAHFNSVAAVASNDVTAVGAEWINGLPRTLVEHWDGLSWTAVPHPEIAVIAGVSSAGNQHFDYVSADRLGHYWAAGSVVNWQGGIEPIVETSAF
jgi:hypothetical protein